MASWSTPNYDDTIRRIEQVVEDRYRDRMRELEEKNRHWERTHMPMAALQPQMQAVQYYPGQIIPISGTSLSPYLNKDEWEFNQNSQTYTKKVVPKRDLKSLVAYYYRRK